MFRSRLLPCLLVLAAVSAALCLLGFQGEASVPSDRPPDQSFAPAAAAPRETDWQLVLVNPWTPMEEGYVPELTRLSNGLSLDSRCAPALNDMLDACQAAGLSPVVCSAYRTWEKQESLFSAQVNKCLAQGYAQEDAQREAARSVAAPGTSEHQLGLAADIVDQSYQSLDDHQAETPVQQWLMAHSWGYGFILRYPPEKSDTTGVIYEPWHYRYVGKEAAQAITRQGVCLEEYLVQ